MHWQSALLISVDTPTNLGTALVIAGDEIYVVGHIPCRDITALKEQ